MQERLPIGVKRLGDVLPKLSPEELEKTRKEFEREQEAEFQKLLIERAKDKGVI